MNTDKEDAEVTESDKEEVQISDRSRRQSTSGTRTLTPTRGGGAETEAEGPAIWVEDPWDWE